MGDVNIIEVCKEKLLEARKNSLISWIECLGFNLDNKENEDMINEIENMIKKIKEMLMQ